MKIELKECDCAEKMRDLAPNSVDAIEQEESYCRMIRRRLENDTPLFDFAEGANNG